MGLFSRKTVLPWEEGTLYAITEGTVMGVDRVKDQMFAEKMMGDGVAFNSTNGVVVSPCEGTVATIFPTNHAIGILTKDGAEILIHIGLDTVNENGKGFKGFVKAGDKVTRGQKLITFDMDALKAKGYDLAIPMIFTAMDDIKDMKVVADGTLISGQEVMKYSL